MAQALPHARLHIVPGAGHTVHLEQPEMFDSIVEDFIHSMNIVKQGHFTVPN
jgi:pimeloyl-ACP methyl ester carboxylesterase